MNAKTEKQYDILVIGGGPAGVASAVTAARGGLKTALVERYGFCGGASVAGLSGTICGLFHGSNNPQSDQPKQLVYGFAEEFRRELKSRGGVTDPQVYGQTWTVTFDPFLWRDSADTLLRNAGVSVYYHSLVTGVIKEGNEYRGIDFHHAGNNYTLLGQRLIDASGDASVLHMGGAKTYCGNNGEIQNPSYMFSIADVDVGKFLAFYGKDTICPDKMIEQITDLHNAGKMNLPRNKIWIFPTPNPNQLLVNATRLAGQDGRMLNILIPEDFSEAEYLGRKMLREYALYLKRYIPGCENSWVCNTGVQVGIRQTRSIVGLKQLKNDDVTGCVKCEDAIARSAWPIELHSGAAPKLHWIIDDWYEIPLGALIPLAGENIITAGRSLCAEHEALASARVSAQCFEYGRAAAAACRISLDKNIPLREVPGTEVRKTMEAEENYTK